MDTRIDRLRHLTLLMASVALCLAAGLAMTAAAQDAGARIRAETRLLEVGSGQLEVLNLVIEEAADVYGIGLRASFDPTTIEIIDTDPRRDGAQMAPGPFLKPDFIVRNSADNHAGTLEYVITQVNPSPPASGSGVVLSILLRGKAKHAPSAFQIDSIEIADRRGNPMPIAAQSSELQVVAPRADQSPAVAALLGQLNGSPAAEATGQPTLEPDTGAAPTMRPDGSPTTIAMGDGPPAVQEPQAVSGSVAASHSDARSERSPMLPDWAGVGVALSGLTIGVVLYRRRRRASRT